MSMDDAEPFASEESRRALLAACAWLDSYFAAVPLPSLPVLHLMGTPFQQRVWRLLLEIPYGRTTTYGTLAREYERRFGSRTSARAVGGAIGRNPISIIVPATACWAQMARSRDTQVGWTANGRYWRSRVPGVRRIAPRPRESGPILVCIRLGRDFSAPFAHRRKNAVVFPVGSCDVVHGYRSGGEGRPKNRALERCRPFGIGCATFFIHDRWDNTCCAN
ncbi:methylated-DNA--[protein]-cysteine S-methyltransferase [Collinsella tanakaei]|uniref:methylated-DNA--[protein]-cysteine S-methyltransferase n=1 Tax=Collinsella tanakaei TaxID=626935 RepID=UPI003F4E61BA